MIIVNPPTLLNAMVKALDDSEGFAPNFPGQVRLIYQNPARIPQAITFVGGSEIHCPSMLIAKGQRVTFSGNVPPELATGTFYGIPSSMYGNEPSSHFFRVATSPELAAIGDFVEFTETAGGFVLDSAIDAQDTLETLMLYEVAGLAPVNITLVSSTYDPVAKKAVADYGAAQFTGSNSPIPISHRLTFFGGIPGQSYYAPFFDLTAAPVSAIDAGGSVSFPITLEFVSE